MQSSQILEYPHRTENLWLESWSDASANKVEIEAELDMSKFFALLSEQLMSDQCEVSYFFLWSQHTKPRWSESGKYPTSDFLRWNPY